MTTTQAPPSLTPEERPRGLAARISLGRAMRPVAIEFVLIAAVALFLTIFGFVMVLSATSASETPFDTAIKQGIFALVGIPLMFVLSRFPVAFWQKTAWFILIAAVAFQMLIYIPALAISGGGNTSWISIAGVQAQPAEFLKLATAIWIGCILARKQALITQWRHFFIPLVPVVALVLATVLGGDDLGTAMMIGMVVFAALFFAGVKLRFIGFLAVVAAGGVGILTAIKPNRVLRITAFLNPNCSVQDDLCYQQQHGLWALANGGVFGVGLGNSTEKYGWLPARGNDFIFAIVGEELGLIGCITVLALFAVLAFAGIRLARRTTSPFVRIVSGAVTVWIVGQALVNIAVVLRLAPPLGVPLPFLSQGGTSLISVLIACGVLLSFARTLPAGDEVAAPPRPARARTPVQQID